MTYSIKQIAEISGSPVATIKSRIRLLNILPVKKDGNRMLYSEADKERILATGGKIKSPRPKLHYDIPEDWGWTMAQICEKAGIKKSEAARRKKHYKVQGVYAMRGGKPVFVYSDEEAELLFKATSGKRGPKPKAVYLDTGPRKQNVPVERVYAQVHARNLWKLSVQYEHGFVVKAVCLDVTQAQQIKSTLEVCGINARISPHLEKREWVHFRGDIDESFEF